MTAVTALSERQEEAVERGLCKCLCGRLQSAHSVYFDYERCRHRASRARVAARAQDMGLTGPLMLSHTALAGMASRIGSPDERRNDAQKSRTAPRRRKPSDDRISLPRLERIARRLLGDDHAQELLAGIQAGRGAGR